jgi:putative spermidine/putrescine transport system permease protein
MSLSPLDLSSRIVPAGKSPARLEPQFAVGYPIISNLNPAPSVSAPVANTRGEPIGATQSLSANVLSQMSRGDKALLTRGLPAWIQAAPFALVFVIFFIVPLCLVVIVSFCDYNEYQILPSYSFRSYSETFEGCLAQLPDLCTVLKTYVSTAKFCFSVWIITLVIGFCIAYFLAFHVRTLTTQMTLFLICTIPFWTSNVIRMISWIPLLGRNGLINQTLMATHLVNQPQEWLLFSEFSVILAFVHLFTFFMVVPIFNSMMRIDRSLLEAAFDAGASGWQTLWNVVIPLSKPGIVIGSIFVVTIVMGDFVTVGVMGGQQIASAGKIIETRLNALQFPPGAANAVILLGITLCIIVALTRIVDIRREL